MQNGARQWKVKHLQLFGWWAEPDGCLHPLWEQGHWKHLTFVFQQPAAVAAVVEVVSCLFEKHFCSSSV